MNFRTIIIFCALAFASFNLYAQDIIESVLVEKVKVIDGLDNLYTHQNLILFDAKSSPKFFDGAKLQINTAAKFIKVKARKTIFENADIKKLNDNIYLLVGSGKYAVEITAFDPEKGIDEQTIAIDLGEPKPTPEPNPPPNPTPGPNPPLPIPDDKFDNIGKRVSEWSAGLPRKLEVAAIYKEIAIQLEQNAALTVGEAGNLLGKKRTDLLGSDLGSYSNFIDKLMNDLKSRWPLDRKSYSEYLLAVYKGLGGV